eukprot:3765446-Pyramimonas_sp.AAC.1
MVGNNIASKLLGLPTQVSGLYLLTPWGGPGTSIDCVVLISKMGREEKEGRGRRWRRGGFYQDSGAPATLTC